MRELLFSLGCVSITSSSFSIVFEEFILIFLINIDVKLKCCQALSFFFSLYHFNDVLGLSFDIWPHIALDFAEEKNPINIYLEGSQSRKVNFLLLMGVKVLVMSIILGDFDEMLRKLFGSNDDNIAQFDLLKCLIPDLFKIVKILFLIMLGTPRVLIAIDAELDLDEKLH
jgi:hypothetical protein